MREYRSNELPDRRNADLLVSIDGKLVPRSEAKISVFDSSVQGGDAVWEGLRVYSGRIFKLGIHLERLRASAHALAFKDVPDIEELRQAVFATLEANGMRDEVHIRLTLTRGPKVTSGMSPKFNRLGPCLIVLAEWKTPVYDNAVGIRLITASIRRNSPQTLDSKIHHNNLLNNILAKIEADFSGVDDALMLDLQGFVSETNATNIFAVIGGGLVTPRADSCLPGITRNTVIELACSNGIDLVERNLSLSEIYCAEEVFVTGTMGEISPVLEVDGRMILSGTVGTLTRELQRLFQEVVTAEGEVIPTPLG